MQQNSNTEQQILDVAEELFLDRGFALTTTTEIARRVGCNQALVHYYFRTKQNLFEKIFENKFTLFTSTISIKQLQTCDLKEIIETMIFKHLEIISANPKIPFLVLNEVTTNPEKFQNLLARVKKAAIPILKDLDEVIQQEKANGRIRDISAFNLIINILSLNIFMFLAKPMLMEVANISSENFVAFALERKDEIFKTVWGGISIQK